MLGAGAAAALTRYIATLLYGITRLDVVSFAAGLLVVVGVVAAAAMLPARRASRLDPSVALRDS